MGEMDLLQKDFEIDLESGDNSEVDDSSRDTGAGVKTHVKALISNVYGVLVDRVCKVEEGKGVPDGVQNCEEVSVENGKMEPQMTPNKSARKVVNEKCKKTSNKKSPKPPRPPRSPSLDAADQKLIRELTELAMLKRARIERMKALKKMKASKESSSGSNVFAMVFTVLFCLVLLSQGMSSKVQPPVGQGSSVSAADVRLISGQFSGYPSTGHRHSSPNLIEVAASSYPPQNLKQGSG